MPQLAEGLMPHAMSKTPEEIDQEFNCYFVAKTRAKKGLFMTTARNVQSPFGQGVTTRTRSAFVNNELAVLKDKGSVSLLPK